MEYNNIPTHVKTYISFDGCQQGANVPIGLQNMVEYLTKRGLLSKLNVVKSIVRDGLYNGLAAKQLLAHHTSANAEFPTPDPLRTQFLINLQAIGEYPSLCRKVAVIDGVSNGVLNQEHPNANESLIHISNQRRGWKSIWGLCNGNICKNVDWECKSTPNYGSAKVTDMWTLDPIINLIFWVPPFETSKYATAAWGNSSEDNAPGGRFGPIFGTLGGNIDQNKITFLLKETFYLLTGSKRTTFSQHINNFTFVPSYSSADLRSPSLTDNSNKNLYMDWSHTYLCGHTPFDYVYAPKDSNQEHVFVSQEGSEWFESEVRCARADLPVFFDPNINSPTTVCNSEIFSIPFCQQSNHSVTWTVSDPNRVTITGSGDQITVTRISSGKVTLTATVTFACSYSAPIIITKDIIVGTQIPFIQYVTYNGQEVGLTALVIPGASYNWYEDGVLTEAGAGNTYTTTVQCNTPLFVQVEAVTVCGTSIKSGRGVYVRCSNGGLSFTASPNPTYSTMSVQLTDTKGQASTDPAQKFYELQVTDKLGTVKKQFKYGGGVKQTNIDLSTLPADLYILRLWDGKSWSGLELIKK